MDVSVDEIIEVCPYIINDNIKLLDDFEEAIIESERVWDVCSKILESSDMSLCAEDIHNSQNCFLEEMHSRICKNRNYSERIEQEIEELKSLQNKLSSSIAENESRLNKIKTKISNLKKKKESLLVTRDKVQICKLLTNTSFVYKRDSVEGYIVGPVSKTMYPFEFNSNKHEPGDITNQLYELLKKASYEPGKKMDVE